MKVQKKMLLDNTAARHKMSVRPPKKHELKHHAAQKNGTAGLFVQVQDDLSRSGLVPMDYLKKVASSRTHTPDSLGHSQKSRKQEAKFNRDVCIGELIETEEEFGKDIQRVVEQYLTPLEEEIRPAPRTVKDNKDLIFNNLKQISAFHNGIMISGVKYFLKEPRTIGRTLLRLERDFDKHAEYVKNEPTAQEILATNDEVRDYFEDLSQEIGDDKTLADHLKLPIQRINDYTLLLQELIKYSRILGEDITDLERALELMLWIPTRCNDLKFITNIEGYHGNIHKLGRLIRHNWFLIKDKSGGKGKERYCFLFKARILICKVRRISEDRCVFVIKEIIKLPDVDFRNRSDKKTFDIHCTEASSGNFPYTFVAHEDDVKADWLREIQEHSEEDLTQAEHVADDLKLQSQNDDDLFEPLKGVELDISPDIEESLGPIEKPGHRPLKHVPEPKRPPLEVPRKRAPIFTCVDPTPSPSPEREPTPETPVEDMYSSYRYEEVTVQEEEYVETDEPEAVEDEVEELIEIPAGKRKPKYIPGVSKPLFHSTIRGSSNEPGENAVFECEVEGVTKLTWLKDNRPLSDRLADRITITEENGVYRLEIKNVTESDSGTYTARAENDCGVSFSTAHLIVEKLSDEERKARAKATSPVFLVQLKDAELLESTHARFIVRVNGNPVPQIEFYKGDKLITSEDERIEIIQDKDHPGFYELVIPEVKPEDAGEYRCVASNKYSDESCSCIVTVTNEKDLFVGLDEDVSPGAPRFSWLKNGKPFLPEERFKVIYKDEEDSIALVFQNVKPEDAGLYTCVASTSHGKISCSAELTIQGTVKELEKLPKKPVIDSTTVEFEGNVASTGVLEVKVTADPLPVVRWFKDGEEITASSRYKTLYDEETEAASLVIKNLSLEDSGEYNIIAKNEVGTASQFVNLHVKAPPRITKKLEDFTGLTGRELRLTIEVNASPKPIVQWYKDGLMIKKSNRIKYDVDESSETYSLVIENAVMEDAGTYSVVASNEFSQVSDVCHISMESPPQFVGSITKEVETLEGDYVSFSVMVDGDPLPQVKWKFNGKEIVPDGKHFKTSSEGAVFTLLISEVKREDAGSYSCEIRNQWGSNECDGQLFVKCLPRFDKELENLQVNESDMDVEFTVKLNAFPKATVTWYHDETEITSKKKEYTCIEEGDTFKLIIKQATTKLSGTYKCKAENDVGYKETTAKLSVYTFPNFKKGLSDMEITEGETLKLTVQCEGVPEPDVKWYKNGEELYSDSRIKISRDAKRIENYNLTITLIQSEDGGEYEVRATNERGTAVTKSLITVLASTDHKKPVIDEEVEVMVNGVSKEDESEKVADSSDSAAQVKDKIIIKLPPRKKVDPKEAPKKNETCEKTPLRKRLSTESGDEDGFTVRELRSEELTAATELRASSFGLVEEPPENEHYIKISISRGVSIVSVSEDETNDDQLSQAFDEPANVGAAKKSKNVYELNEEDELNLELNEDLEVFTDDGTQMNSFFQKQSKLNENVMNAINKRLSSLEDGNDANLVSYDSSRKSSVIEECEKPQKNLTKPKEDAEKTPLNSSEMRDKKEDGTPRVSNLEKSDKTSEEIPLLPTNNADKKKPKEEAEMALANSFENNVEKDAGTSKVSTLETCDRITENTRKTPSHIDENLNGADKIRKPTVSLTEISKPCEKKADEAVRLPSEEIDMQEDTEKPQKSSVGKSDQKENVVERKSALRVNSVEDTSKKIAKAVSFDEHPSRIIESDNTDEAVEELFKRIQTQRSILGEILEKQNLASENPADKMNPNPKKPIHNRRMSREIVTDVAIEEPQSVNIVRIDDKRHRAESVDLSATLDINAGKLKVKNFDDGCESQSRSCSERRRFSTRTDSMDEEVDVSRTRQEKFSKSETTEVSDGGDFTVKRRVSSYSSSSETQSTSFTSRRSNRFGTGTIDVSEVLEIEMQNDGDTKIYDSSSHKIGTGDRRPSSLLKDTDNNKSESTGSRRGSKYDDTVSSSVLRRRGSKFGTDADVSGVIEIEVQTDNANKIDNSLDQREDRIRRRHSLLKKDDKKDTYNDDCNRRDSSTEVSSSVIKRTNRFGSSATDVSKEVEIKVEKDSGIDRDKDEEDKVESFQMKRRSNINIGEDESVTKDRRRGSALSETECSDSSLTVQRKTHYVNESVDESAVLEIESKRGNNETRLVSDQEEESRKTRRRSTLKSYDEDELSINKLRRRGSRLSEEVVDITGRVNVDGEKSNDRNIKLLSDSDFEKKSKSMCAEISLDESDEKKLSKLSRKWSTDDTMDTSRNTESSRLKLKESSVSVEKTQKFSRLSSQISTDETKNITLSTPADKKDNPKDITKTNSEEKPKLGRYPSQKSSDDVESRSASRRGSKFIDTGDTSFADIAKDGLSSDLPEDSQKLRKSISEVLENNVSSESVPKLEPTKLVSQKSVPDSDISKIQDSEYPFANDSNNGQGLLVGSRKNSQSQENLDDATEKIDNISMRKAILKDSSLTRSLSSQKSLENIVPSESQIGSQVEADSVDISEGIKKLTLAEPDLPRLQKGSSQTYDDESKLTDTSSRRGSNLRDNSIDLVEEENKPKQSNTSRVPRVSSQISNDEPKSADTSSRRASCLKGDSVDQVEDKSKPEQNDVKKKVLRPQISDDKAKSIDSNSRRGSRLKSDAIDQVEYKSKPEQNGKHVPSKSDSIDADSSDIPLGIEKVNSDVPRLQRHSSDINDEIKPKDISIRRGSHSRKDSMDELQGGIKAEQSDRKVLDRFDSAGSDYNIAGSRRGSRLSTDILKEIKKVDEVESDIPKAQQFSTRNDSLIRSRRGSHLRNDSVDKPEDKSKEGQNDSIASQLNSVGTNDDISSGSRRSSYYSIPESSDTYKPKSREVDYLSSQESTEPLATSVTGRRRECGLKGDSVDINDSTGASEPKPGDTMSEHKLENVRRHSSPGSFEEPSKTPGSRRGSRLKSELTDIAEVGNIKPDAVEVAISDIRPSFPRTASQASVDESNSLKPANRRGSHLKSESIDGNNKIGLDSGLDRSAATDKSSKQPLISQGSIVESSPSLGRRSGSKLAGIGKDNDETDVDLRKSLSRPSSLDKDGNSTKPSRRGSNFRADSTDISVENNKPQDRSKSSLGIEDQQKPLFTRASVDDAVKPNLSRQTSQANEKDGTKEINVPTERVSTVSRLSSRNSSDECPQPKVNSRRGSQLKSETLGDGVDYGDDITAMIESVNKTLSRFSSRNSVDESQKPAVQDRRGSSLSADIADECEKVDGNRITRSLSSKDNTDGDSWHSAVCSRRGSQLDETDDNVDLARKPDEKALARLPSQNSVDGSKKGTFGSRRGSRLGGDTQDTLDSVTKKPERSSISVEKKMEKPLSRRGTMTEPDAQVAASRRSSTVGADSMDANEPSSRAYSRLSSLRSRDDSAKAADRRPSKVGSTDLSSADQLDTSPLSNDEINKTNVEIREPPSALAGAGLPKGDAELNGDESNDKREKLLKKPSMRSATLDSISDLSFDDDKGAGSKRGSLVVDSKSGEKGEFPRVLSGMDEDIDTFESLSAAFEVQGFGVPRPSVLWFKDGQEIKESKHFVMSENGDKYKLQICDLKASDAGVYSAKLVNSVGETSKEAKLIVQNVENLRGPKLRIPLRDEIVVQKQTAVLEATFIADPVPDAKWTVDGNDANADFSVDVKELDLDLKECTFRMTIPSTELSDTGTYKVKVKNKFDSAESSASLTIVMKPEIEVFKDLVVPPTMPCTFEVIVKSTPEAEVTWYVNGQKITSGSKHRVSSEKIDEFKTLHRLSLEDCQLSDEGEYKIEAENNVGKSDAVASLKLYTEKPSFLKLLEDRTVQDYDLLQMKVRVNGLPVPELKWFKNGKEIISDDHLKVDIWESGQVSTMLSIDHFTKDDVAEYKVVAKNIVGQAETSAKLTLTQIEPSFIEPLKRVTEVSEGEPLDISTKVIGSPIPSVQWFKDGEEIKSDDERIKTSAAPDGTLKLNIDKVNATDSGAYKAVAVNDLGKSIANTAVVVEKAPKKPSFVKKLEDIDVVEGQPIKLELQIDGFPEPTVKWLKDGHPLHPCPQMDFVCGPNSIYGLVIEKATLPDLGQYSAIVSNRSGEESSSCNVKIIPSDKAPVFQTQLQPVKVVDGYPAKLEVKVDGFPLPKLTWYFNGNPLKIDNENIKLGTTPEGNHCLLIEKVTPENSGEYEVLAKNDIGDNSSKACLTVSSRSNSEMEHEKPVFLHGLRDVTVDESGELSISAPFRGNPIPDVQWYKDGSLLLPSERIHFTCDGYKVGLQIQDVNMGDMGFYSCALKNPYGEDSTAGHVGVRKLYQAPVFTQRFRHIQQLPKHDAKFHCRVTGVPFPSVMWHRNGLPISNSEKYQIKRDGDVCCLTVFSVGHDDEATYSCIASNRDGTATCEAQLQVVDKVDMAPKQEAPQFMKKIGDCEIYAGMTAKFTACASGYPEPEYEWFCDTVRLHPSNRIEMEKEGTGLVRLKISSANPDIDRGRYKLRAYNPHGEAFCEANLAFDDGLETKYKRPVGELYKDYDRFRATGAPLPLADKPIIRCMTDRYLTLSWKPSIPIGPREPVTYLVEMEEQPHGKWFTARSGLRSCICDIHNLKPFVDYKFRVRVENNYGISDPSPFAITYREKLEPDPPRIRTHLPSNASFHPDTSHYFPKDFDIERPPHDNYAQAPRFLRQEYDAQYGVKSHNVNLFWFVYGYPKPKITYYFNDELIEMGGRYDCSYTRNGQATLFINKMLDRDVGVYEAVAVNEHGTARQRVQLKISEYPEFLKRPSESWVPLRKTCRLEARVIGVPYPEIKWYKDWKPLAPSSRIQIEKVEPDLCILRINDVILKDEGLYSISARNIAGSISTSVYLHVEENDYDVIVGGKRGSVLTRNKRFDDIYDLGDELGRGTQGITFHAVERNTGKNLAAKVMHGSGDLRKWMNNELDIMNHLNHPNIIRPYDSLISSKSFTIIEELASGGEILDVLTRKTFITEYEISRYIKQLLLALDHMHEFNIGHLGLTPGDLLFSHPGGDRLKLCDFGLSRRINSRKLEPLYFGMPEFVAPEIANGEGVNLSADLWSVGVITHLLLTGVSLFRGKDDVDTLDRIKESRFSVNTDISEDARDFIVKLLMINPNNRLDIRTALNHRWIRMGESVTPPATDCQINTENLRNYYNLYKDWYNNSSCRTWFRRRPLESAYNDPSRMIYPPGRSYSPAPTPEPPSEKEMNHQYKSWKDQIPSREQLDAEIGLIKSESHYQYGPDTYLLQLRDVDFPVRLREYMKVAKKSTSEGFDWQAPVIRERRRFMDVMDEEIDDERKARINQYGSADIYTLRRLKQELGARPTAHVEAEAILGSRIDGLPPFFREKPQLLPVEIGKPAELICYAVGSPKPLVQWFKNDLVITENNRVKILEDNDGRSILRLDPASELDLGIYKVVARNKFGQTTARTRLAPATEPNPPEAPEVADVSDTEVLLKWKQPKDDGNSPVLCYGLHYQENDDGKWKVIAENIDHEAWVVHDLKSSTNYQFRLLAMNKIGWSIPGFPTNNVTTKMTGAEKIIVPHVLRNMQLVCEKGKEIIGDEPRTVPDYSLEFHPLQWEEQPPEEKYRFISEITRGQYSIIVKAMNSADRKLVVAKLMETNATTEPEIDHEFDILKTLRHERIAYLIEGFKLQFSSVAIFILEKLQGADILTYLCSRHTYSEQMVATIITQVLDGLQYLHWRGYCHLNLQPDNIAMASVRSLQVKLVDFSCAQRVNRLGTVVSNKGHIEYTAPEILCDEPAYPYSDIWSVGVLTYILLSGVSPFKGISELETRQNITFVRYRFEHLYKDLSQEALRFLMFLFKRTPSKRPSAEDCHEHRWLLPTEYMIKKREKTHFDTAKLKVFSDEYHSKREAVATKSKEILSVLGGRVHRSNSIIEELQVSSTGALH